MTDIQLAIITIHLVIIEFSIFLGSLLIAKAIKTYCKKENNNE